MVLRLPDPRRAATIVGATVGGPVFCAILGLAAGGGAAGCEPSAEVVERPITVHVPRACAIDPRQAYSLFYAGGDFDPALGTPFQGVFLREQGMTIGLPGDTRSLIADVSQGSDVRSWRGLASVRPEGPVDVLVWPQDEACRLSTDVERRQASSIAAIDEHRVIVVGGRSLQDASVPRTYVADLSTGDVRALELGVASRRSQPTITRFVGGALVAGGADPDTGAPLDTAEVYVAGAGGGLGDFDQTPIRLTEARSLHGAVTLLNGRTLLVGGEGARGALSTMEVVDPVARTRRTQGVAKLQYARKAPVVLRLASGEILVAGGIDNQGKPVPQLEWFSPDASAATKRPRELVATTRRDFIALPAGGALAVMAPDIESKDFKSVWIITGDGALEPGIPVGGLSDVQLFPGPEGAPLLWTGSRWLRYEPWFGAFSAIADAPAAGPPGDLTTAAAPDAGLVVWLRDDAEQGMHLWGYRHGVRNAYQAVAGSLLVDSPRFFAPDRAPGESARYDDRLGLVLAPGASALLTDVTFARVVVEVEGPTGAVPWVVLRQESGVEVAVGGPDCPLLGGSRVRVERARDTVTASVDGSPPIACTKKLDRAERVSVLLRGGPTTSSSKRVTVSRRPGD